MGTCRSRGTRRTRTGTKRSARLRRSVSRKRKVLQVYSPEKACVPGEVHCEELKGKKKVKPENTQTGYEENVREQDAQKNSDENPPEQTVEPGNVQELQVKKQGYIEKNVLEGNAKEGGVRGAEDRVRA